MRTSKSDTEMSPSTVELCNKALKLAFTLQPTGVMILVLQST